jgi:uncharacterized membrane protein YuzA (DUF378 family)
MKTFTEVLHDSPVQLVSKNLVILGALVWLFVGIQKKNYVEVFAGQYASYVYILVGLAGLYLLYKEVMWAYMPHATQTTVTPK